MDDYVFAVIVDRHDQGEDANNLSKNLIRFALI